MKKILFILLIGWITLSACAGVAATPSIAVDDDFHPTDPKTVNLAAGKPQFVEFFAFW
jgi:flagellar basal body-associated protein FliL